MLTELAYSNPSNCSSPTGRSLTVHGSSTLRLAPDAVTFSLGLQTRSPRVMDAFNANCARVNDVISAIKKGGVTSEEIQTSSFHVSTVTLYKTTPRAFQVESIITITRSDTAAVGALLQTAVDAAANQAGSLQFSVADRSSARQRGFTLAFQNDRARAESLAVLATLILGDVTCASEDSLGPAQIGEYVKLQSLGYL